MKFFYYMSVEKQEYYEGHQLIHTPSLKLEELEALFSDHMRRCIPGRDDITYTVMNFNANEISQPFDIGFSVGNHDYIAEKEYEDNPEGDNLLLMSMFQFLFNPKTGYDVGSIRIEFTVSD